MHEVPRSLSLARGQRSPIMLGPSVLLSLGLAVTNHRAGSPLSPTLVGYEPATSVLIRYIYDGSTLSQGRLTHLPDVVDNQVSSNQVWSAIAADGVDIERWSAAAYETTASTGAWMTLPPPQSHEAMAFPLSDPDDDHGGGARRIDIKLSAKGTGVSMDAAAALTADVPCGKIAPSGYFGIGVVNTKNQANVGTLWRSAYQLGASFLFTIGTRYRHVPTDTVSAPQRVPLFEHNDWNAFVEAAPRGALWVAVEMGGTPLADFEHPRDAVYLLGSEDAGLPTSVMRACHRVVSIECENYASYNVAVAGSLIMYDRMAKERKRVRQWEEEEQKGTGVGGVE